MCISIAKKTDYAGIINIWKERFTTNKLTLYNVKNLLLPLCTSYVYKENGKIIACLSTFNINFISENIIPHKNAPNSTITKNNTPYNYLPNCNQIPPINNTTANNPKGNSEIIILKGAYMFGLAVKKEKQGQAIGKKLVEKLKEDLSSNAYDFIMERPAEQSLNNYYLNLGFNYKIKRQAYNIPSFILSISSSINMCAPMLLEDIRTNFNKRFEWEDINILKYLILEEEITSHITHQTKEYLTEDVFVAVASLNPSINPVIFKDAFFCFPYE